MGEGQRDFECWIIGRLPKKSGWAPLHLALLPLWPRREPCWCQLHMLHWPSALRPVELMASLLRSVFAHLSCVIIWSRLMKLKVHANGQGLETVIVLKVLSPNGYLRRLLIISFTVYTVRVCFRYAASSHVQYVSLKHPIWVCVYFVAEGCVVLGWQAWCEWCNLDAVGEFTWKCRSAVLKKLPELFHILELSLHIMPPFCPSEGKGSTKMTKATLDV